MQKEALEQEKIFNWARAMEYKYPCLKWLYACPNGGKRNPREAFSLKRQGVKKGVADIHLPYKSRYIINDYPREYIGLYIELKVGKNKPTDNQREFITDMIRAGHKSGICYGADEAIRQIEEYCKGVCL